MIDWLRDVRLAARSLRASPGFTLVAVASLALGIGVNVGVFSLVRSVLWKPLPYRDPSRVVVLWERNIPRQREKNVVNPANFLEWKRQNTAFEDMALSFRTSRTFAAASASASASVEAPERLPGRAVTANFFALFGAAPEAGRGFLPEEETPAEAVAGSATTPVILSWNAWRGRFGGDPAILGRSFSTDDGLAVVVGVMPKSFRPLGSEEYWEPFPLVRNALLFQGRYAVGWARLKPGVSLTQARASLDGIAARLEAAHPEFDTGWRITAVPLAEEIIGNARTVLVLLFATVTLVLLIACANLASLVLSRAAGRDREVAVRLALGASLGRIARQAVTESLLVSIAGAGAGLVAARWALDALTTRAGDAIPRLDEVRLDGSALGYSALLAAVVGVVFGLLPLKRRAAEDVAGALRASGSRSTPGARTVAARGSLAVVQIAVSLVLTVGTGLLVRTMANLQRVELGFDPEGVATFRVILPQRYEGQKAPAFYEELVARVRRLPGVRSAGAASGVPLGGPDVGTNFTVVGRPEPPAGQKPLTDVRRVDASYLATVGIPLLRGRALSETDRAGAPAVAVVNRALVRDVFGGDDARALGARLAVGFSPPDGPVEIVGIVGDVVGSGVDEPVRSTVYLEQRQSPPGMMTVAVRMAPGAASVLPAVRRTVQQLDPGIAIDRVGSLDDLVAASLATRRFPMYFLAPFSILALLLAAVGVYGVLALAVRQRVRELGIRIALGAEPRDLVRMILGHAARIAGVGAVAGALLAFATTRAMRSLLYGVAPSDPWTLAAAVLLVLAVALAASLIPARSAWTTDPVIALRQE